MCDEEKQISFLNNCFIFKKVRNVSNIPSLIKNSEVDEQNKMESLNNDKKLLDEEIEKIVDTNIEFKKTQQIKKNQEEIKQKELKPELTIDEKIKLAEEKKKAKNY